jgi:hypothetical protein
MKLKLFATSLVLIALTICVYAIPTSSTTNNSIEDNVEIENVKKTVVEAYVEGIFLQGNAKLLKKGWHPDCDIVIFENRGITKLPAKYWIDRLEKNPKPLDPSVTYKFIDVKVTGYAAIAIIEIFSDGKQVYTDYMCLYKFKDGWKIATKIYYAFPK